MYAKWQALSYIVTYDSKDGSSVSPDTFLAEGSIAAAPTEPTLSGFSFVGWSATDGGSKISFPYFPGVTTDITLYAKWEAESGPTNPTPNDPDIKQSATTVVASKIRFQTGSSEITSTIEKAIKKAVAKGGKDANYVITAGVGEMAGISTRSERQLARNRAKEIASMLVKLGVNVKNVKVILKDYRRGQIPKTKITTKSSTS